MFYSSPPPTLEYGSEWDTDGEATIAENRKKLQRKRQRELEALPTKQTRKVEQTPKFIKQAGNLSTPSKNNLNAKRPL